MFFFKKTFQDWIIIRPRLETLRDFSLNRKRPISCQDNFGNFTSDSESKTDTRTAER